MFIVNKEILMKPSQINYPFGKTVYNPGTYDEYSIETEEYIEKEYKLEEFKELMNDNSNRL